MRVDERCQVCGIDKGRGSAESQRIHRVYHDAVVNGIPRPPLKSEQIIWCDHDARIIVVTPSSPFAGRVRARKVARLANREMGYDGWTVYSEHEKPDEQCRHIFVHAAKERFVALAEFGLADHAWRFTWEEYGKGNAKQIEPMPPRIWSLSLIWVHSSQRGRGIAKRLFQEGLSYLRAPPESVGFYTPFTEAGKKFAQRLYPSEFLVAK